MVYICDRRERPRLAPTREHIRNTTSRGTGCPFSVIASELPLYQGWELKHRPKYKFSIYNHAPSPHPGAHPSHRRIPSQTQAITQALFNTGKYKELNPVKATLLKLLTNLI